MRMKRTLVAVPLLLLAACSGPPRLNAPTTPTASQPLTATPSQVDFDFISESDLIDLQYKTQTGADYSATVANPSVASTSWSTFNSADLVTPLTVLATGIGKTVIRVAVNGTPDGVNIPVSVDPDFTKVSVVFGGDVKKLNPQPLAGSQIQNCAGVGSYAEKVVVSLTRAGAGTFTVQDTPGFDRGYAVTAASGFSFTSHGTFSLFGAAIPGDLSIAFTSLNQLTFQETTTYNSGTSAVCANTYGGTLSRQ
jgi:hypothetical protein